MSTQKFVSRLADDVHMIILHNPISQKGDCDEEEYDRLFGNIQQVWRPLLDCLTFPAQKACEDMLRGLHVDYEGTKVQALNFFGILAESPRSFVRIDLV